MKILSIGLRAIGVAFFAVTFILGLVHYTVLSVDTTTGIAYDIWGLPTSGRNSLLHGFVGFVGFWAGIAIGYAAYSAGTRLEKR